jgi:hypothetical protein
MQDYSSIGCPNLRPVAYSAVNIDRLLDQGAREYVNHPRGATLKGGTLHVSSIYTWFKEDFGGTTGVILNHLRKYAKSPLSEILESYRGELTDGYDWRLNGTETSVWEDE